MQKNHTENTRKKRIKELSALLVLCALLTACAPSQPSAGNDTEPSQASQTAEVFAQTEEGAQTEEENAGQSQTAEGSSEGAAASQDASENSLETAETVTQPDPESEDTPDVTPSATEPTTSATTTITSVTASSSTVKEDTKPPAPVVIPDVKTVSSPGTKVFKADSAVIDYSNASSGYISAKYTGKSSKAQLRLISGGKTYTHQIPVDGTTVYLPLSCGSGSYQVQFYELVSGIDYAKPIDETFSVSISDSTGVFLYPNMYVDFVKSSACVKKAAELCAGLSSPIDKIGAIFTYVADTVSYDNQLAATVQSGYVPNPDKTLSKKTGICFDYAALFAAMTRSQNIPTRLVIGYASPDIYHAWNEVYTPETGWITAELYLKQNGYNIVDATFYSGASNKAEIAKFISNESNYSALYYY